MFLSSHSTGALSVTFFFHQSTSKNDNAIIAKDVGIRIQIDLNQYIRA
jgi:hypothetical protein